MPLQYFDGARLKSDAMLETIDKHGYVIIENLLSNADLTKLKQQLEPYFEDRALSQAKFFGYKTKRIEALFGKSNITQEMALQSNVLEIVNHVLGDNCDGFNINLTQGIRITPGEKAQLLHPDSAMFPIEQKPFEFMVNAMWAYSDFTTKNGATLIVPGSHKWEADREPQPNEIIAAEMKAGSVLIYQGSIIHGGGANTTLNHRTGIVISYCLGWLRQSENQYLSYPLETVKTFSSQLQQMLGYNVHKPNLGWVHGHNPYDLLTNKDNSHLGAQEFLTDEQNQFLDEYLAGEEKALTSHNL